jgi:hypothetical protein
MAPDSKLRTAAGYSELCDGQPIKPVRALDGVSILRGRRLSMHLMVQPEASSLFLSDPVLRDQGLLSRVLVAAPDSIAGTRRYRAPKMRCDQSLWRPHLVAAGSSVACRSRSVAGIRASSTVSVGRSGSSLARVL